MQILIIVNICIFKILIKNKERQRKAKAKKEN